MPFPWARYKPLPQMLPPLDLAVLLVTVAGIVAFGLWKSRAVRTSDDYLRGSRSMRWPTIGLSVMATQASAVTFLSLPGQAYEDGLGFVQFYFGLPLAMVVLSATFIPRFLRANVYTAYEILEARFDLKTRVLTAVLFLIQRGLAAGITIYAPSIVLSHVLHWPLALTNLAVGILVILYTVSGGTTAVAQTQKYQMVVMMLGIVSAAIFAVSALPEAVSAGDAVALAGAMGKLSAIDLSFDPRSRYTLWSGLTGGFFLAMAYFGTDQSQVSRYLAGRSVAEARLGLLFNGLFKVPMQLLILFAGVLVFVFHTFEPPPLLFNRAALESTRAGVAVAESEDVEARHRDAVAARRDAAHDFVAARRSGDESGLQRAAARLRETDALVERQRDAAKRSASRARGADARDADYIFISFVLSHLPVGLVGLLLAVIFSAAMSSVASELTALSSTLAIDVYKRLLRPQASDRQLLVASKGFTVLFGLLALAFASVASVVDNLIEAINILGSLFYGVVLGIFVVAFFLPKVRATPVFVAAILGEGMVVGFHLLTDLGFLWFNVLGCAAVVGIAAAFDRLTPGRLGPSARW